MATITKPAPTEYATRCFHCGATFTYALSDVWRNYVKGGEVVSCPSCGETCRHAPVRP